MTLDEPGEVGIDFIPRDRCSYDTLQEPVVPDHMRLQVLPTTGLRAALEWPLEQAAIKWFHPGPRGRFPDDWIPATDEPVRLVPGVDVDFVVAIIDDDGEPVAWDYSDGQLRARASDGSERSWRLNDSILWPLRSDPEHELRIDLELDDTRLPVADVIATSADDARSLEIVAAYSRGTEDGDWIRPAGARAMVRDADGHVIIGTPVQWSLLEGTLAMSSEYPWSDLPMPPEYLGLQGQCVPDPTRPETRRATLHARLGPLEDTLELQWTAEPSDREFTPSPSCVTGQSLDIEPRGCACATEPRPFALGALLPWLLLRLRPRRRPRRP